jgi:hypothetical protein
MNPRHNAAIEHDPLYVARFWSKVDVRGMHACWEWKRHRGKRGYGTVGRYRKVELAHRVAYEIAVGPTNGLCVLHKCDNPPCCNPKHLFLGTKGDNNKDRQKKGRYRGTNCKVTFEQVEEMRRLRAGGMLQRELAEMFRLHPAHISRIVNGLERVDA